MIIHRAFGFPILAVLVLWWFSPSQGQTTQGDSLTLEQAIALALENHPSLRASEANVQSASSGLTQAESGYYPSLSASASFVRNDGAFVFNPSFPPRTQTYNSYTTGFQVQQTIFDFGKTIEKVSANSRFLDAAVSDDQATRQSVMANTALAYFGLVQAVQVAQVNQEAVDQAARHLAEAQAFYTVGKRAKFDVTKAEVDLANANVALITARNQMRLAEVQLENSMGVHSPNGYAVRGEFSVEPFALSLDTVKAITLQERPEVVSAAARVEASRALVSSAWDQNLPTLSATGSWTWSNFDLPTLYPRWSAGFTLTLPIFQGFGIAAQTDQARANADAAQANLDVLKESVLLESEQNYLSLKEADERLAATAKLVQQAQENLTLAERQYAAGVGTALEVTDAQLSLSNARITRIQALYDYNSSFVRLQRAMGALR